MWHCRDGAPESAHEPSGIDIVEVHAVAVVGDHPGNDRRTGAVAHPWLDIDGRHRRRGVRRGNGRVGHSLTHGGLVAQVDGRLVHGEATHGVQRAWPLHIGHVVELDESGTRCGRLHGGEVRQGVAIGSARLAGRQGLNGVGRNDDEVWIELPQVAHHRRVELVAGDPCRTSGIIQVGNRTRHRDATGLREDHETPLPLTGERHEVGRPHDRTGITRQYDGVGALGVHQSAIGN